MQYGCGPVGCSIVRLAATEPDIDIVGAIDLVYVGRGLGELANTKAPLEVSVSNDPDSVLNETKPDIVFHATGSSLKVIYPQLENIVKAKANVVSTCEELSYPYRKEPELAAAIDRLAKKHQVTVLGTGVNPGFIMDTWPLVMTAVCQEVKRIRVARVQNASRRRVPFQRKIGAGMTVDQFNKLVGSGSLKHVGLPESLAMIAAGLECELDDITESIEPVIAKTEVRSNSVSVRVGQVAGVKQTGHGWKDGKELITLDFKAYIGAKKSYDAVYIKGIPNIEVMIKGGIPGDTATAAIVVNSAKRILEVPHGLLTMKDLPLVFKRRVTP